MQLPPGRSKQGTRTMNRQDGHLEFDRKRNNFIYYAHGQLCLEQAKVAINCLGGSLQEWMEKKIKVL
jgi:hypothetical protein